ncbi:glycosyltransferase, partial [Vibrio sp. T13N]|uniref:glycosyltransferase n=1 Tax=Vibrio sp. T13N TaxID=3080011 RepID=UPI0029428A68
MDNNKRFCREQKVIFPAEYIPKLPFQPERYKVFSELKGYIVERGYEVLFSNYIRIPGKHAFSFSNIPINKNEVIEYSNGFDCVHAHYIMPDGHLARELCKIKKTPYIVSVRQGDLDRLEKIKKHTWLYKKYKKIVDDASAVIAINEKIHNYLKNEFGIV